MGCRKPQTKAQQIEYRISHQNGFKDTWLEIGGKKEDMWKLKIKKKWKGINRNSMGVRIWNTKSRLMDDNWKSEVLHHLRNTQ